MSRLVSVSLVFLACASLDVRGANYPAALDALGRPATSEEIRAWDIDVRPDFQGLPPGSGSVAGGETLWLERCANCHGDFGDSNAFFTPIALGNVTEEDIESGRVAALRDPAVVRTTFMKVATLSTLWDYINRAMPWNAPKSLTTDEVYAVLAYLLNLAYIVDYDFVLSNDNISEVQQRMPNRNGMTREHGLWTASGRPDVIGSACVTDCAVGTSITSYLPDYAMDAHGNLQEQMRDYGPFPGIQTEPDKASAAPRGGSGEEGDAPLLLLSQSGCIGCHQVGKSLVGPAFDDIRERYAGRKASAYLAEKIREGGQGVWGNAVMPPMRQLDAKAVMALANWLSGQ